MIQLKFVVLRSLLSPGRVELGSVLLHEVSVFGTPGPAKVLDLHHLWQHRLVEFVLQCCARIIASENVFLKETNFMLNMNGDRLF